MHTEVEQCFEDYLNIAALALAEAEVKDVHADNNRLLAVLERLEKMNEFVSLARATGRAFKRSDFDLKIGGKWEMHIQALLCLSGVYARLVQGLSIPFPEFHKRYREAFESRSKNITYLAPLEFVEFAKESIDFGQFRFSSTGRRDATRDGDSLSKKC